jgi:hypothetical protein
MVVVSLANMVKSGRPHDTTQASAFQLAPAALLCARICPDHNVTPGYRDYIGSDFSFDPGEEMTGKRTPD